MAGASVTLGIAVSAYGLLALRFYAREATPTNQYLEALRARLASDSPSAWPELVDLYARSWDVTRPIVREMQGARFDRDDTRSDDELARIERERIVARTAEVDPGFYDDLLSVLAAPNHWPEITDGDDPLWHSMLTERTHDEATDGPPPAPKPSTENPSLSDVMMAERAGLYRTLLQPLRYRVVVRSPEGRGYDPSEDIAAMFEIARRAAERAWSFDFVVAYTMHDAAADLTADTASHAATLGDTGLLALDRVLAAAAQSLPAPIAQPEIEFVLDIVQRAFTDNGRGGGRITADGYDEMTGSIDEEWLRAAIAWGQDEPPTPLVERLAKPLWALRVPDRATITEQLLAIAAAAEGFSGTEGTLLEAAGVDRERTLPTVVTVAEELERSMGRARDAETRIAAARLVVAAERFRLATGAYPTSSQMLVPAYLASPPIEASTGTPLILRIVDGAPAVFAEHAWTPTPNPVTDIVEKVLRSEPGSTEDAADERRIYPRPE